MLFPCAFPFCSKFRPLYKLFRMKALQGWDMSLHASDCNKTSWISLEQPVLQCLHVRDPLLCVIPDGYNPLYIQETQNKAFPPSTLFAQCPEICGSISRVFQNLLGQSSHLSEMSPMSNLAAEAYIRAL